MSRFSGALKAEESFRKWEEEQKTRRWRYWSALRTIRTEYEKTSGSTISNGSSGFYEYLEKTYGIRPVLTREGQLTDSFDVIDGPLSTFFMLKYFK
jgi:hypothetical protein